jgi:type IV pilus assembly protein PilQ
MNKKKPFIILCCFIGALYLSACATTGTMESAKGEGAPVIQSVDIKDDEITIQFSKPFDYTIYKPGDPFSVVVEFPGVDPGQFTEKIVSDKKGITEVTPELVTEPVKSTKLAILLQNPAKLIPEVTGNTLVLRVEGEEGTGVAEGEVTKTKEAMEEAPPAVQEAAETQESSKEMPAETEIKEGVTAPQEATEITSVKFERVQDAVKVIIETNGPVKPNVFPLAEKVVLDFKGVKLATKMPKEVAYPLKGIRAAAHKDKTRIVLDMTKKASYDVVSIGNSVVVSLTAPDLMKQVAEGEAGAEEKAAEETAAKREEPQKAQAASQPTQASEMKEEEALEEDRYIGKRISLDFQDADIVPIFRLFADVSGYNVVVSPDVKGKITMKLINVPWDQALDLVLRTHNLGKQIDGNIIRIAPNKELAQESEEKARAKESLMKAQPLATKIFTVNYAGVDRIKDAVDKAKLLSPRGSMTIDERASVIIINDVADTFPKVQSFIKQLDKPDLQVRQVLIEARIVEATTNYVKEIGVQWGAFARTNDFELTGGGLTAIGGQGFTGNNFIVNLPAAIQQGTGGAVGLGWMNAARTLALDLQLSALENTGNGKIISNPRIITMNNTPAKITQGSTIYVAVATSDKTDVKPINAVLSLDVTPTIAPGGAVLMKLKIAKDEPGPTVNGNTTVNTNTVETSALVNTGETVVIGGIYRNNLTRQVDGVPFFQKIPILGWLFKKDSLREDNAEILVFITPRVVSYNANNKN